MRYYHLEFLVRARSWDEVVKIFKDELQIDRRKQNASNRDIDGLFLIKLRLSDEELSSKFYSSVLKSSNVAIISDPKSDLIRNKILDEISKVEHRLRKLLLNVSDVVEDYHAYFSQTWAKEVAKKKDVIFEDDLNPVTSYLGFDDIITIFGLDKSSWDGKGLTANDLLELIQDTSDINDLRRKLRKNIQKNIVWDQISKHVLKTRMRWEEILPELNELRSLRNKAAHFRVLTEKDLVDARRLVKSILGKSEKKETVTQEDIERLRTATYPQFTKILESAQQAAAILTHAQKQISDPLELLASRLAASQVVASKTIERNAVLMEALRRRLEAYNLDSNQEKTGEAKNG